MAWFTWGAVVIAWMIWRDLHLPHCLALYGASSAHDSTELFLDCEDSNRGTIFAVQAIAIGVLVASILPFAALVAFEVPTKVICLVRKCRATLSEP